MYAFDLATFIILAQFSDVSLLGCSGYDFYFVEKMENTEVETDAEFKFVNGVLHFLNCFRAFKL